LSEKTRNPTPLPAGSVVKMLKRWLKTIGAVVSLLLVSGLILVLMMAGANLIKSFSINVMKEADWINEHIVQATFTVTTILNFYYLISGIVFLGFFFLMEHRLITTGIPQKIVLRRTFFTVGVELLILALIQLAMMTYTPVLPFQVGLAVIEILLSIGLIYLGRRKASISRG
jgi:hypothetical protein